MKKTIKIIISVIVSVAIVTTLTACIKLETDLSHLNRALLTPEVVQLKTAEQGQRGVWLEHYLFDINGLEGLIESVHLSGLESSLKNATYKNGIYLLELQHYEYRLDDCSLKVKYDGEFRFSYTYTENEKVIEYQDDLYHELYRESNGEIYFTKNDTTYHLTVSDDGYAIDCDYDGVGSFTITKEIYDTEGRFIQMKASHPYYGADYTAYALAHDYTVDGLIPAIIDASGNKYKVHGFKNPTDDTSTLIYGLLEYSRNSQGNNRQSLHFVFMRDGYSFPEALQPIND